MANNGGQQSNNGPTQHETTRGHTGNNDNQDQQHRPNGGQHAPKRRTKSQQAVYNRVPTAIIEEAQLHPAWIPPPTYDATAKDIHYQRTLDRVTGLIQVIQAADSAGDDPSAHEMELSIHKLSILLMKPFKAQLQSHRRAVDYWSGKLASQQRRSHQLFREIEHSRAQLYRAQQQLANAERERGDVLQTDSSYAPWQPADDSDHHFDHELHTNQERQRAAQATKAAMETASPMTPAPAKRHPTTPRAPSPTNGSNFDGGGILNDGTLTLHNSTLAHNSADFGGGITSDNEGSQRLLLNELADWDTTTEELCAAGRP